MTSIAILEAINTTAVQFRGQPIITAMVAGVAYVAMRPIVENIGIDWTGQSVKLRNQKEKFNCRDISMVAADGKVRKLLCLPLQKMNGWLFSINPERVRADIKDKLIQYQEECFTVLYDYWTKGEAVNPRKTTTDDRTPLRGLVNRIMGKYGMTYQAVYKLIHKEFSVSHIDELSHEQMPEAMGYLAGKAIDGEFLGKSKSVADRRYHFPVETAEPHDRKYGNDWITPRVILDELNRAPELELIDALEKDGYDVKGAKIRIHAMYGITKQFMEMQKDISDMRRYLSAMKDIVEYQTSERGMNVSFTGKDKGGAWGGYVKRRLPR